MYKQIDRKSIVQKRHYRLRRRLAGTSERPRLAIFRSGKHMYAQVIDDTAHTTLVSASTVDPDLRKTIKSGANLEAAQQVGALIAKRAKEKGIEAVVFDRGGNLYHGRIAALAASAREAGLQF